VPLPTVALPIGSAATSGAVHSASTGTVGGADAASAAAAVVAGCSWCCSCCWFTN
jgi:Ni,Fe-hydrogenase III small subunit